MIPTGLPLERFELSGENRFRRRHGIPDDATVLLYVGRVAFEKNIEFLMESFARVRRRAPAAKLVIAGEGPALAELKRRAGRLGLAADILFIGYLDRRTRLVECYHASDVFVFASETETQGLVLLEAMACGLPVVSSASMGTTDVLSEGQGCLIAPLEPEAFAERVMTLIGEPFRARELARRGRDYVRQWSTEVKAGEMLAFYRRVLGLEPERGGSLSGPLKSSGERAAPVEVEGA